MIKRFEHGGNVYQPAPEGKEWLDFSANINPLGLSPAVRQALAAHLGEVVHYPDPAGTALRQALKKAYGMPEGALVLGNGAAELFIFICILSDLSGSCCRSLLSVNTNGRHELPGPSLIMAI